MPEVEVGTKRGNGYDEYGQIDVLKRARQEDGNTKLRLLVVGRYCGALIGKGGENFKRLREQYSVKITGLSSRANERVLQLDGNRESCISIIKELLPLCPNGPYPAQNQKCAFELNMLVNTDQVGSLIGKGGLKIKEICEQSGGKLKVYPDCLPNSNERVVSLGGEDESRIVAGIDIVLGILDNYPQKTQTIYFDPNNTTTPLVVTGNTPSVLGQVTSPINRSNVTSDVNVAAILIANRENNQRGIRDLATDFGLVQTVTTLTVPNDMCGAIIGKAGMNVRQVRLSSGAKIDFTKNEAGSKADREITLTGTQEQVQIAEQLISQFVRSSSNLQRSANQATQYET